MSLLRVLLLFVAALPLTLPAPANASPAWLRDGEAAFTALVEGQAADFEAMQAQFRQAREQAPEDAALAMTHCDFYWRVWDLESVDWAGEAATLHEQCLESLEKGWADEPQVQVFVLEQRWGEQSDREARLLWKYSKDWPRDLRGRLALRLANADFDDAETGRYAVAAARAGQAGALVQALEHLAAQGKAEAAVALAKAAPDAGSKSELDNRLEALLDLPLPTAALDHLRRHEANDIQASPVWAARSLIKAGDVEAAGAVLDEAKTENAAITEARLQLAMAAGDAAAAARHFEFDPDKLGASARAYVGIVRLDPLQALMPSLLPATLVMLAVALVLMMFPLPLLAPVHYRGLARRVANRAPEPLFPGIGLRHAWYGIGFALVVVPMVVMALVDPVMLQHTFDGADELGDQMFRTTLFTTLASLVAMLPMLFWMRRSQWTLPSGQVLRAAGWVLAAYLLAFAVAVLCNVVESLLENGGIATGEPSLVQSLHDQGLAQYGVAMTFLLIAVLVPVLEEWLFRGVLLGGMAKHISFGWANLLQASLFMLIHDDVTAFPFYLSIGLLAGWLVKRYRSLLPAIALHMLNNGIATWLQL